MSVQLAKKYNEIEKIKQEFLLKIETISPEKLNTVLLKVECITPPGAKYINRPVVCIYGNYRKLW